MKDLDTMTTQCSSKPRWTVVSNVVSPEDSTWVGTCWEFFDREEQAKHCYDRQIQSGNSPAKRPYYEKTDQDHLGAVHRMRDNKLSYSKGAWPRCVCGHPAEYHDNDGFCCGNFEDFKAVGERGQSSCQCREYVSQEA